MVGNRTTQALDLISMHMEETPPAKIDCCTYRFHSICTFLHGDMEISRFGRKERENLSPLVRLSSQKRGSLAYLDLTLVDYHHSPIVPQVQHNCRSME